MPLLVEALDLPDLLDVADLIDDGSWWDDDSDSRQCETCGDTWADHGVASGHSVMRILCNGRLVRP